MRLHASTPCASTPLAVADDAEARAQAEALAAAEAAADALFVSDGIGGGTSPVMAGWPAANSSSSSGLSPSLMSRMDGGMGGGMDGGMDGGMGGGGDDDGPLPELRQRAAASALVEELRLEGAKSARLEKIISKLMGELRAAKLHAAAAGGGPRALGAFEAATTRLEAQSTPRPTTQARRMPRRWPLWDRWLRWHRD